MAKLTLSWTWTELLLDRTSVSMMSKFSNSIAMCKAHFERRFFAATMAGSDSIALITPDEKCWTSIFNSQTADSTQLTIKIVILNVCLKFIFWFLKVRNVSQQVNHRLTIASFQQRCHIVTIGIDHIWYVKTYIWTQWSEYLIGSVVTKLTFIR